MEKWVHESLSNLLAFPVTPDLTEYILQMQNETDVEEYLKSLLDYKDPKHRQFIAEFKKRLALHNDQAGYKKSNDNNNITKKQNEKKKSKAKGKENTVVQESVKPEKVEKKKTKFVNLYSQEGHDRTTILLQGRHRCNCEAKKHSLINNCLNCGRIVCFQEGPGPCLFCNELVCSPEQQAILAKNTKQSDILYKKLMEQKPSKSLQESLKQRDKLIEYDRNSARRTKVIDDESDYYQSHNVWLSAAEREKLKKKEEEINAQKHASRLSKKVTLDFTGRQVITEDNVTDDYHEEEFKELLESIPFNDIDDSNACPTVDFERPIYIDQNTCRSSGSKANTVSVRKSRIQDKEFLEITDEGLCLSMHQPYASLLVAGIKTHEGRNWYSPHRGRLWIASTSKTPTSEEISSIKACYTVLKNEEIVFPDRYPTSSLLGCVTVTDVLPQEEYRKVYPDGESSSPYVFICENPIATPINFPIQGKHKIYKLDSKIHQAAVKSIEKFIKSMKE